METLNFQILLPQRKMGWYSRRLAYSVKGGFCWKFNDHLLVSMVKGQFREAISSKYPEGRSLARCEEKTQQAAVFTLPTHTIPLLIQQLVWIILVL